MEIRFETMSPVFFMHHSNKLISQLLNIFLLHLFLNDIIIGTSPVPHCVLGGFEERT